MKQKKGLDRGKLVCEVYSQALHFAKVHTCVSYSSTCRCYMAILLGSELDYYPKHELPGSSLFHSDTLAVT